MKFNAEIYFSQLKELPEYLLRFAKNPVQGIRTTPAWSWPATLSVQGGIAAISGACLAVLNQNFFDFLLALFIFPVSSIIISLVMMFFFYYFFAFFESTFLEFRRLYAIIVLANIPYLLFHILSGLLPPIDLLGFAMTALLLIVGLVEQFKVPKKTVVKLVAFIYIIFFLMWINVQIRSTWQPDEKINATKPESLDKLERDLKSQ